MNNVTDDFTAEEKTLIALATPIGTNLLSAEGAFREALETGGYVLPIFPAELNDEVTALAIGVWCDSTPMLTPILTPAREAARTRALVVLNLIRSGEWAPATENKSFSLGEPLSAAEGITGEKNIKQTSMTTSSPATRQSADSGVRITAESPNAVMKNYAAILARNASIPFNIGTSREKGRLAREAGAIFAKEIQNNPYIAAMSIEDAIKAADYSDPSGSVGLLSGTMAIQRALELFQFEYPILSNISDDFSDAPGLLNQTEVTRIVLKPAVQTRSTAVDSAGRPVGWNTVSPAQTVDVPVTLTAHVGVPIVFGQNVLASTVRNLFAEQAPMALYALGGFAVDLLTGLMTSANFNAYQAVTVGTGSTNSTTSITVASTAGMYPGQAISGTAIAANSFVASITSGTVAVLTQPATATNVGPLTFTLNAGKVPTTYTTYIKALASFAMSSLSDVKSAMDSLEVPMQNRFALLNSSYYSKLSQDASFNTFWAAMQSPDIISKGQLPGLQGIFPINAPYFPTSSNRTGFVGHKSSLILKSRLPNDILGAVGGQLPGNVTTITASGGMSVMLVQYASLREGYAE